MDGWRSRWGRLYLLACIRLWIRYLAQQGVGVRGALDFQSRDGRGRSLTFRLLSLLKAHILSKETVRA